MRRREFLKTSATVAAAATLPAVSFAVPSSVESPRVVLPINRNWRYKPSRVAGAEAVSFDDSKFERIVIPHTNVKMPWHNFDDKMYEFVSTYRRRFKTPAAAKGKRVFIDFEGAMTASTVYINGQNLGEHKGGLRRSPSSLRSI